MRSMRSISHSLSRTLPLLVFIVSALSMTVAGVLGSESEAPLSALHAANAPVPDIEPAVIDAVAADSAASVFIHLAAPPDDDAAIARAQDVVISALGPEFQTTHRYAHIPAIAGRLTRVGVERIESARLAFAQVTSIAIDPEIVPYDLALETSVRFIGGDRARRAGHSGRGINVAVLDTGVDTRNLDLSDAIVAQLCTLEPADRCGPEDHPADDTDGHGTHVAGIVASRGKRGGFGVAPDAGIIAVKFLETRGSGVGSDFVGALDILLERDDLHVINMSLGTTTLFEGDCDDLNAYSRALSQAFGRLKDAGVTSVAASGNDGAKSTMGSPACIASVVSVGAVDHTKREIASFTNRSATLDLMAPGVGIVATSIRGGTSTKSGTSMASPHVAGAIAVLMGAAPWASPDQLEQILKDNGQRPTIRLDGNEITTIKLDTALNELLDMAPTETPIGPSATPVPTETPTPEPTDIPPTPTITPTVPTETPTSTPPEPTPTEVGEEPTPTPDGGSGTPGSVEVTIYMPRVVRE